MATAAEIQAKVDKLVVDMDRARQIVNGSDTTDVTTDNGAVPSFAKLQKQKSDEIDTQLVRAYAANVTRSTKAQLDAVVGSYPDGAVGMALRDPDVNLRGTYTRVAGAWANREPLPTDVSNQALAATQLLHDNVADMQADVNTARSDTLTARTEAETARGGSEAARDAAEGYAQDALENATGLLFAELEDAEGGTNTTKAMNSLRTAQSIAKFIGVTVLHFGAKGDGVVDDTAAFQAAMNYCETNHIPLRIPRGTYKLATWTTRDSSYVMMHGDGLGVTTIIGPKVADTHFVKMMSGTLDLEGISFQKFDNVGYSEVTVDLVKIVRCKAKWNRQYLYKQADVTDFPASSVGRAILNSNEVELSGGFMLHGALLHGGLACNNVMKDVGRDASIWTSDTPLWQTFGISFGDTDNNNSIVSQSLVGAVNIIGNIIDGMFNAATIGNFNTTNAIQVSAISAVVTGNLIRGMDATDGTNCEAIYCKAQNYNISGNTIVDGTKNSACIAVKGTLNMYGPMQKNGLISTNVIVAKNNFSESGIVVFAGGTFGILNNLIDGMGKDSIKCYNDPYNARIANNHILNNGGTDAITLPSGSVTNVQIIDNTIDGVLATSGDMRPIKVTSNAKTLSTAIVTNGGSGYTSVPTVTISGGGGSAIAQATIKDGAVIGIIINGSDPNFTSVPTITISGGGGSGATATAVLSTGKVNDLSIQRNRIKWSPKTGLNSACGIYVQSDSVETLSSGGFSIKDNEIIADSAANLGIIQGVNLYSPTAGWFRDAEIDGLRMVGPDPSAIRPVNFNSAQSLHAQAAHYQSLEINNVKVNGLRRRILSKAQIDDTRATFVVALSGAAVGSKFIGNIPNNVMVMRALIFTNAAPTSATSTGKIAFSIGAAGLKQILADTLVTAFAANTFNACIPDGAAANAKRAFGAAGLVPVYMDVTVEALTGGTLTLILETEAIA